MGLKWRRASDIVQGHYGVLLAGESGAGKSYTIARAPKPIICTLEAHAVAAYRAANPKAAVFVASSIQEVFEFHNAAIAGEFVGEFESVGFDGLSEFVAQKKRELKDQEFKRKRGRPATRRTSKGEKIKLGHAIDSLDDVDFSGWPAVIDQGERLLAKARRIIEKHHYLTTVNTVVDRGRTQFALPGKVLPAAVARYFNIVGHVVKILAVESGTNDQERIRAAREGKFIRRVAVSGDEHIVTKECTPLSGLLVPEPAQWFRLIDDHVMAQGAKEEARG